jgi:D-alanine-D-alanine ligase
MYGVKTTPFISINNTSEIELLRAETFLDQHKVIYIKATNQGSSVGCYRVSKIEDLRKNLEEAFTFSPFVILEKEIKGRELEVAVFEFNDELLVTGPGEIICPNDFYTYEEKYNKDSKTITKTIAPDISESHLVTIKAQSEIAFRTLKLRHLSRIDFFLSEENEILINEINTFPGHTQISMFPSMLENTGVRYSEFINSHLKDLSKTSV